MKKFLLFSFLLVSLSLSAAAPVDFDRYFSDRTLRIDYIFSGNARQQFIALDELHVAEGWAGRRVNLDEVPLRGNGQITMRDAATKAVIYKTSFSTLFQEWVSTEEATATTRSFENVFQLPMPRQNAEVTVELYNPRQQTTATFTHLVKIDDILIRPLPSASPYPHRYLHKGGDSKQCIDIAIVAEGYRAEEMDVFYRDAQVATDELLSYAPYSTYKDRFNIVAVAVPSAESGVSIPHKKEWKTTALNSHFDTFYSERYLTTLSLKTLNNALAGVPYEHIIILTNTDNYGGGGIYNSYTLVAAHHALYKPVVVHEFGHSFAGLADEYFYDSAYGELFPTDVEPWEQNLTTRVDFAQKWQDMLPKGTPIPTPTQGKPDTDMTRIGVYEGGGYQSKGVYRAFRDCRMRTNEAPTFCAVCRRATQRLIQFYTEQK